MRGSCLEAISQLKPGFEEFPPLEPAIFGERTPLSTGRPEGVQVYLKAEGGSRFEFRELKRERESRCRNCRSRTVCKVERGSPLTSPGSRLRYAEAFCCASNCPVGRTASVGVGLRSIRSGGRSTRFHSRPSLCPCPRGLLSVGNCGAFTRFQSSSFREKGNLESAPRGRE